MPDQSDQVIDWLQAGISPSLVTSRLVDGGMEKREAEELVNKLDTVRRQATREAGVRNLQYGFAWFAISGGAMYVYYASQPEASFRPYLAIGSATLFGLVLILRGAVQYLRS